MGNVNNKKESRTTITISLDTKVALEKLKERLSYWLGFDEDCLTWDEFFKQVILIVKLYILENKRK